MNDIKEPDSTMKLESLNKKVDAVIDHSASQFGDLTSRLDLFESLHWVQLRKESNGTDADDPGKAEIFTALAKAQLEIRNAEKNVDNEFTKKPYADLASVLDAVREPLAKNGIALFQITADPGDGKLGIRTVLAHTSGQTIEDVITMSPVKWDPQGVGSCRTYMRRYSILAICGIAGANDDDAEAAQGDPNDYPRITEAEAEKILITADELCGDRADEVIKRMLKGVFGGVANLGDIREGQTETALTAVKNAADLMAKKAAAAKAAEQVAKKAADAKL
jgi:hypothetical protein